ncbi:hypothetical protein ACHAXA_005064 [Cyclostephanos tholiformis]|uniref:Uncharacterized protein n=1 Tax=Cyclostephanos tholiformis TaxID=382380 RepID=A0ABD3SS92_9STRA
MSSSSSPPEDGGAIDVVDATSCSKNIVVDPFCHRQFAEGGDDNGRGYAGTVLDVSISYFEDVVNSRYDANNLVDGYAPFCKHMFVINDFTNARVNVLPITGDNEIHLRTRYESRTESELPVLTRYFDRESLLRGGEEEEEEDDDVLPIARYLDLILYSREQIEKENIAMGKNAMEGGGTMREMAPWGIVSIKAQNVDFELPMTPITMMRNALGKDQGGSGVMLCREAYMESVAYWRDHANVL